MSKIKERIFKYKLCLRADKGEKITLLCNELVDQGFYDESLRYKGSPKYSSLNILYNFYISYKKNGIYSLLDSRGKKSNMPKKGSTKKDWEVERKKKIDELLKKLPKEELINIIKDYNEIMPDSKRDKIDAYNKVLEKKTKHSKISIANWCLLLNISKSYFYKLENATPTVDRRRRPDEPIVKELINKIFFESNKTYGARRILAVLNDQYGLGISYKTVYNYMVQLGLKSVIRAKNQRRVDLKNTRVTCENVLNRKFDNEIWNNVICTDVTYIKWREYFIYLSANIDLRSNEIVGWACSLRNDNALVMKSFEQVDLSKYRMVHSDHGYQYSSITFTRLLKDMKIIQSMSRLGKSLDNRPIEYWFSVIKEECLNLHDINKLSYEEVVELISNFIEYYNVRRIQLCLKNLPPVEYKKKVLNI